MRCKYLPQDLQARLDDTVCRYKKTPYYVRTTGAGTVRLFKLTNLHKSINEIQPTDTEFDISSPMLGYINFGLDEGFANNKVYYARRRPIRRYKQGLNVQSTNFVTLDGVVERRFPTTEIMYSKAMEECILGEYPTLDNVLTWFRENFKPGLRFEAAISREIALELGKNSIINVFYKEFEVGWMTLKENVVHVPSGEWAWVISKFLQPLNWRVD